MLPHIQEQYDSLSEKRQKLLQRIDNYSEDELSFKAGPDKWSAKEAIEHLVVVEDNFLEQVSAHRPVSSLDPDKRSSKNYQIVLKVMRKDVAVDVPHESMEPHGEFSLTELFKRWDAIREKMQALLEEIDEKSEEDLVYEHPYAGPLNIAETLEFIDVHFDNHARHMGVILARAE